MQLTRYLRVVFVCIQMAIKTGQDAEFVRRQNEAVRRREIGLYHEEEIRKTNGRRAKSAWESDSSSEHWSDSN